MGAYFLKHFLVTVACVSEEDDVIALELLVKPPHHVMHHLVGGCVDLIDVGIVEVVLIPGRETVEDGNGIGLAKGVYPRELLRLARGNDHIHGLEFGQGQDAVGHIQVVLGVKHLEIDVLVGDVACTIQCQQETFIKVGIEIGLLGRCALVKLERQDHGDIDLVFQPLAHQVVIQVKDARLVVGSQFINRDG